MKDCLTQKQISDYMPLVVTLAKKYINRGIELDELVSAGSLGLVEAARRFDDSKEVVFATYARHWILGAIIRVFSDKDYNTADIDLDLIEDDVDGVEVKMQRQGHIEAVRHLLDTFSKEERDILNKRFGLTGGAPMSYKEIGEEMGVSKQRVEQIIKDLLSCCTKYPRNLVLKGQ